MFADEEEDGDIKPLVVLIMVLPSVRQEACDHDQYSPSPSNFPAVFNDLTIEIRFRELPDYRGGVEGRDGGSTREMSREKNERRKWGVLLR